MRSCIRRLGASSFFSTPIARNLKSNPSAQLYLTTLKPSPASQFLIGIPLPVQNPTPKAAMLLARRLPRTAVLRLPMWTQQRPLATKRAPALADIAPDAPESFNERQKVFREKLKEEAEAKRRKEQEESACLSAHRRWLTTAEEARTREEAMSGRRAGPFTNLIYGTPEGRQLDRELERSFSQVLARGKYVHSIVFHDVKPDCVDEYVDLVGSWYPKVASMPEMKVNLVGSWRSEVGDCDTFGAGPQP
jgi:hypothetical protein